MEQQQGQDCQFFIMYAFCKLPFIPIAYDVVKGKTEGKSPDGMSLGIFQ
jgi:hypothetical protein